MTALQETEITADSPDSFEDAMCIAVRRARQLRYDVNGLWLKERTMIVGDERPPRYHVGVVFLVQPAIPRPPGRGYSSTPEAGAFG